MPDSRPDLVVPFLGEHYAAGGTLDDLIAPPYDVLAPQDRTRFADRSEYNIVHLSLPEGEPDRYACAAQLLAAWRARAVLRRSGRPGVMVLAQEFSAPDGQSVIRTGVIGAVAVEPFTTRRIRPHERTHAGPKRDRLALLRATRAMFEALLMMTRDADGRLQAALRAVASRPPDARGTLDDVALRCWWVTGSEAAAITAAAGEVLYLADGHHRYETALAFKDEVPAAARTLALIVPLGDPGVIVRPTHRVITGRRPDPARLMAALRERFHVHDLSSSGEATTALEASRGRGTTAALLLAGRAALLELKPGIAFPADPAIPAEVAALDVTRVDAWVVSPLEAASGGEAQRTYTSDAAEAARAVRTGSAAAAVLLNPPAVEDVLGVADARGVMPQKSTYFQPKVPSGLVLLDVTA